MAVSTPLTDRAARHVVAAMADRDTGNEVVAKLQEVAVATVEKAVTLGVGAVAGTGVTGAEADAIVHRTTITLTAASVTMVDHTTAGNEGGLKVYDFPEGLIYVLGAVCDLAVLAGAGGIADTAALVASMGTVTAAAADATLTTTEANIIPSTAVSTAALVAGAGTIKGRSTTPAVLDGTTTPVDAYLNFAVPDAGTTADDTLTVTGTITLTWINLGDVA